MMKWEQRENDDGQRLLIVEAPWDDIAADFNDIVAQYARIPLSGFRPGKVPRPVIEQRFRREIIGDLEQRAAQRLGRDALREAGIETLGPVEAEDIKCDKGKPVRFNVRFHPLPEITLPDLASIRIDRRDNSARDQISLSLLELVPFNVPDALVRDELALDGIDGGEPGSPEWKAASDRIRLMLILKRIARQEGIEVDEKDVNRRISEKAKEFGATAAALQQELEQGGGTERLRDMLIAESTLDYLLERVTAGE